MTVLLASQSPRRADLLREAGIGFEVELPRFDEPGMDGWRFSAVELAESLAYFKARSVADARPDRLVLGELTVVSICGAFLGMPRDRDDARRMLSMHSGTTQEVITGVALVHLARRQRMIRHAVTRVTMKRLTDDELNDYLDTGDWAGKAGAYGIQNVGDRFVTKVDGSFSNVVGLPIELVTEMIRTFGGVEN